jgi:hypothetical protein
MSPLSAIVEAWQEVNGARSKTNSDFIMRFVSAASNELAVQATAAAAATHLRI